jgi:8-oxo-dGTP pyrophosphatase MutT (NUDIX family)
MPVDTPDLVALLEAFDPPDPQQASHLRTMHDLAGGERDATSRYLFEPGHFTASGFVASPNGAGVLLIHHHKIGRWLQPGGHIEPEDETIEAAARREVQEETGLDAMDSLGLLDIDIHEFPARGNDPAHLHLDIRFGFRARTGLIAPGDGTLDVRWIPFAEVARWNPEVSVTRPSVALGNLTAG